MQAAQVAQHSQQGSTGLVRPQRLRLLHVRLHEPVLPLHALLPLHIGQRSALTRCQWACSSAEYTKAATDLCRS